MNKNANRITISLPDYIAYRLKEEVPAGQVSQFVTEAVEQRLLETQLKKQAVSLREKSPIKRFIAQSENYPETNSKKILEAIKKGRK